MFSGIIEARAKVQQATQMPSLVQIRVERPREFDDIRLGDSVCTNGVCLTVEAFDADTMQFALGAETLAITGWSAAALLGSHVNLERSMRLGDRIHGHLVSGHVDAMGSIKKITPEGGSIFIDIEVPEKLLAYIWKKGSWAMNGVSLTVNSIENNVVQVCLIPETLKRTNLGELKAGSPVSIEVDTVARGLIHALQLQMAEALKAQARPQGLS
jgi:riboflavin synthase